MLFVLFVFFYKNEDKKTTQKQRISWHKLLWRENQIIIVFVVISLYTCHVWTFSFFQVSTFFTLYKWSMIVGFDHSIFILYCALIFIFFFIFFAFICFCVQYFISLVFMITYYYDTELLLTLRLALFFCFAVMLCVSCIWINCREKKKFIY